MVELTEEQVGRCRLALIGGGPYGFGMGYRQWLGQTSPADSLRPEIEAKAAVCEKVYEGATSLSNADAATVSDLLDG